MSRNRTAFLAISSAIFFVLCVVQMFLAGSGVFHGGDIFAASNTNMDPHRVLGNALAGIALVVVVAAFVTRDRRYIVVSLVALVLSGITGMLATGGKDTPWLGGVHVIVGLVIVALSGWLAHNSSKAMRTAKDPANA